MCQIGEKEKFLSEYLVAIELQSKPHPVSQKLPIPDDGMTLLECVLLKTAVFLKVLEYLSDHEVLRSVGRVNRWFYRLSRDNVLWKRRLHATYPEIAYVLRITKFGLHCKCCLFRNFGPQDLSINWLQRYHFEFDAVCSFHVC